MITKKTENFVRNFLVIREEYLAAKASYEEAEAVLKEVLSDEENKSIDIDGHTISLVLNKRRSFDVNMLRELVSASVFRKVTEPAVRTTLFDAAVKLGKIDNEVIEQVVSVTPYVQLRFG